MDSHKRNIIFAVCISAVIIYAGYQQFSDFEFKITLDDGSEEMCVVCEQKGSIDNRLGIIAIEISIASFAISLMLLIRKNKESGVGLDKERRGLDYPPDNDGDKIKKLGKMIERIEEDLANAKNMQEELENKLQEKETTFTTRIRNTSPAYVNDS